MWNSETGNPNVTEGRCAVGGGGGAEGNGFWPACRSVHDGEDVSFALGGREWAHNVDVNVGETPGWNWYVLGGRGDVCVDFRLLAGDTFAGPGGDVFRHVGPEETGGDEPLSCSDTRMG
jgi:hypothetical protein